MFMLMTKKTFPFNPETFESKWQKKWEEARLYEAIDFDKKKKRYILIEFPYPSGERLHVGHGRSFTALDAYSRKLRMQGFNVLYPFGWDAFGLPAENYAIKTGINPAITTKKNIINSRIQAKRWGLSIDWGREVDTTDPKYYKWTQWIFLKLFEKGLAYQAEVPVNWCPFCKTNLAQEEVLADGTHERCGRPTQRRMQKQWLLKITAYAQRLLDDLKIVDFLPKIRIQQENWIGRSEGAEIEFEVEGSGEKIKVFTTRPDTLFGVTAMVLAPEHPLLAKLVTPENKAQVEGYIERAKEKSELERTELVKEKTGVFTGSYCINPANNEKIPIWVGDYVIGWYGGGAVMVVPAHDHRDFDFAKKYHLEIREVVSEGKLINSGKFDGLSSQKAKEEIVGYLALKKLAKKVVQFKLRDWVFSRQHYWGEPIPIIHCQKCGIVPVPEKDLPVKLPYLEKYQPSGTGESPLANVESWVKVKCPVCGGWGRRETDTMPNWAGSNWYFIRYCDSKNDQKLADPKKLKYWLPVDLYNGGMEHTTLHLLYSRFIYKFLFDIGVVPGSEPYGRRHSHGVVLGPDGQKMSKSKGNVVNPDDVVAKFGADTFRLYESFMGPFEQMIAWDEKGVVGAFRFLKKVWQLSCQKVQEEKTPPSLLTSLHQLIIKVTGDLDNLRFNTAIAAMMEFSNAWEKEFLAGGEALIFLKLLAPFAPHLTEELWQRLGQEFSIHQSNWPVADPKLAKEEMATVIIQVNGKLRSQIRIKDRQSKIQDEVETLAKKEINVSKYLESQKIKKVIFIPGRLVNFVI